MDGRTPAVGFLMRYEFDYVRKDGGRMSDEGKRVYVFTNDGEQFALKKAQYQNKKQGWHAKAELVSATPNQTAWGHVRGHVSKPDEVWSVWYHSPAIGCMLQQGKK